jgi:hypothetical protein
VLCPYFECFKVGFLVVLILQAHFVPVLELVRHNSKLKLQKLAPGTYKYKYIVDGEWQHSPDYPMVSDNAGGFNNEITVAGITYGFMYTVKILSVEDDGIPFVSIWSLVAV